MLLKPESEQEEDDASLNEFSPTLTQTGNK